MQATVIAGLLGVSVSAALLLGADTALALMGTDPSASELHDMAKQYLSIRHAPCFGLFCMTWVVSGPVIWARQMDFTLSRRDSDIRNMRQMLGRVWAVCSPSWWHLSRT